LSLLVGHFDYMDRGVLDRTHLRFFTHRSLLKLVRAAGLSVARATASPAPLHRVVPERWHGRLLTGLDALSARTARALPRVLGYQLILGLRREPRGAGGPPVAAVDPSLGVADERGHRPADRGA
jgi:hypothetical protein